MKECEFCGLTDNLVEIANHPYTYLCRGCICDVGETIGNTISKFMRTYGTDDLQKEE